MKRFLGLFLLILLFACDSQQQNKKSPSELFQEPRVIEASFDKGYSINAVTGERVKLLINALNDTIVTAKPVQIKGILKMGSDLIKPDITELGNPEVTEANKNIFTLPSGLQEIEFHEIKSKRDRSFVAYNTFGDSVSTGKRLKLYPKVFPLEPPKPQSSLLPFIKNNASVNLQYLDVQNGMNNSKVISVTEDIHGNIWIATAGGGASKYDGANFYHYTVSNGLISNFINTIFADSKGNIWFGNEVGGVCLFDGHDFKYYDESRGLISNAITTICEDKMGNVWIGTADEGAIKYDGEFFTFYTPKEGLEIKYVSSIVADDSNNVWISSGQGGLSKFDGNDFYTLDSKAIPWNYRIKCMVMDKNDNLWLGTLGSGIYGFDGLSAYNYTTEHGLANNFISSLACVDNEIYAGTFWYGISVVEGQEITNYNVDFGLTSNRIQHLFADHSGNVWAGTFGGGMNVFFNNQFQYFAPSESGSNHVVMSILQEDENTYWFGCDEGGLIKYDGENYERYTMESGLPCSFIWALLVDQNNELWFGTATGGVCRLEPPQVTVLDHKQGVSSQNITDLLQDKNGGYWFSTTNGINYFDGEYITTYTENSGMSTSLIFDMMIDHQGQVWAGTYGGGALRIDGEDFTFFSEKEGLPSNTVITIVEDSKHNIWFGTSNGVAIFDGQVFYSYTTEQGLPDNEIHSILEDKEGGFWIGTMNGLAFMELETTEQSSTNSELANYRVKARFHVGDGLKSNELLYKSALQDLSNNLWWGTGKGLVKLDRDEFILSTHTPGIQISGIDLNGINSIDYLNNNKDITYTSRASVFSYPMGLKLDSKTNNVTFHYISTDQINTKDIYYSYILAGFDKDWSKPDKGIVADYKKLPGGKYVFKVKAMNLSGDWSEPEEYSFKVSPPWYNTLLAKLAYVFFILLIMLAYSQWRTQKLKKRKDELETEVKKATLKIENQRDEVQQQKGIIESAITEMKASIAYAKHIQESVFPPINSLKKLFPHSFIFYQPRDIVAGDFYWFHETESAVYVAAADCTGHGVPGAIVSVICNNALSRAIFEFGLHDPGMILDKTREIIIHEFSQAEKEVKDGMDIALCCIEKKTLKYAGAYNPIWIIRNDELIELKGDKQPVGSYLNMKPFSTQTMKIQKGDVIYLFSDGYIDQFGGPKGKKFKRGSLKQLLLSLRQQDLGQQLNTIQQKFTEWKGDFDQVDDVVLIGFQID